MENNQTRVYDMVAKVVKARFADLRALGLAKTSLSQTIYELKTKKCIEMGYDREGFFYAVVPGSTRPLDGRFGTRAA
jgi:hypothetical protein